MNEKKRFPWFRFIIWLAAVGFGIYLAFTWKDTWFDIALPLCSVFGVVHFARRARGR